MRVWMVGFTQAGLERAREVASALAEDGDEVSLWAPARLADMADVCAYERLSSWAEQAFAQADALVFVSACGIAVRAIAPLVADKYRDPAVVCVDETGRYAVALLSGHVGGANALARRVARACGGQAVVTTATDVNGVFAIDEWAARNGLAILERDAARAVSAALLDGEPVALESDVALQGALPAGLVPAAGAACRIGVRIGLDGDLRPFETTLHLVPRAVTVGVGCKRGVSAARIAELVDACLWEAHVTPEAVATLATIDRKADEQGLLELSCERGWGLRLHAAEELAAVPGSFSSSAFVREVVGVDNVCERAACACGETLLLPRRSENGVTVALGCRVPQLSFDDPLGEERA